MILRKFQDFPYDTVIRKFRAIRPTSTIKDVTLIKRFDFLQDLIIQKWRDDKDFTIDSKRLQDTINTSYLILLNLLIEEGYLIQLQANGRQKIYTLPKDFKYITYESNDNWLRKYRTLYYSDRLNTTQEVQNKSECLQGELFSPKDFEPNIKDFKLDELLNKGYKITITIEKDTRYISCNSSIQ